jgi:hypothetical protein
MVSIRKASNASVGGAQLQAFRIVWFAVIVIFSIGVLIIRQRLDLSVGTPPPHREPIGGGSGDKAPSSDAYRKKTELLRKESVDPTAPTSPVTAKGSTAKDTDDAPANDDKSSTSSVVEGTYLGPLRTEGSKHATVMAMASGYGLSVYRNYVGSLRKSGFEGKIILGVKPPLQSDVEQYFAEQNVTPKILQFVNCTFEPLVRKNDKIDSHVKEQNTCAHPYSDIKLRWSRFPLLRDWLEECEECTGPVLISDARDVFFQRDPFGVGAPEVKGLQVFEEHNTMTTANWLVSGVLAPCKSMDFSSPPLKSPMLCSGTTIGTRDAMLRYLSTMYKEMQAWTKDKKCCCNPMNGDDQSIHNYLFYTGQLPFAKAIPNRMGIVNTAGVRGSFVLESHAAHWAKEGLSRPKAMSKPYHGAERHEWIGKEFDLVDSSGFLTDQNGERSRVVHQYDRFGLPMTNYLNGNKGPLYEHLNG